MSRARRGGVKKNEFEAWGDRLNRGMQARLCHVDAGKWLLSGICRRGYFSEKVADSGEVYPLVYMNTAKLFKNGESQAVRLPKGYRFKGKEVYITKHSNIVMLIPQSQDGWDLMRGAVHEFSDDFFDGGRQQPKNQDRAGFS